MGGKPRADAKSARWGASFPDSAATGYPVSFQRWEPRTGRWKFVFTGSGGGRKLTEAAVRRQLKPDCTGNVEPSGWYRFAWVRRWYRQRRRGGCHKMRNPPWSAVIDPERSSPAVWHPGPKAKEGTNDGN